MSWTHKLYIITCCSVLVTLLTAVTTCLTKLCKENRFLLAHSLRVHGIVWLAGQQECEAAGCTALTSREQERRTLQLHSPLPFVTVWYFSP